VTCNTRERISLLYTKENDSSIDISSSNAEYENDPNRAGQRAATLNGQFFSELRRRMLLNRTKSLIILNYI
jgi:hypothetical protein